MKRKIAELICKLLGVNISPPPLKVVRITHTFIKEIDLSNQVLTDETILDFSNSEIQTIHLPAKQISDKTTIYINDKKYENKNL